MNSFINYYSSTGNKSKHTLTALKTSIKRIERIVDKPIDKWTKAILKPDIVNGLNSISSKIQTLTTLNRYYEFKKWDNNTIKEELNKYVKARTENGKKQEMTEKEKTNWINYDELKQRIEEASDSYLTGDKAFTKYRNFLMLALYVLMPPARISNYLNMLFKPTKKRNIKAYPKTNNYITKIDNKYKFIFNDFKTSKYLGQIEYLIDNDKLNALINLWFNEYNTKAKNFLTNYNGDEIKQTNFSNGLKNISREVLGKELNLNMLRHIYLTWFMANSSNKSIEEKEKILKVVGQTYKPSRAELYARADKLDDNSEAAAAAEPVENEE